MWPESAVLEIKFRHMNQPVAQSMAMSQFQNPMSAVEFPAEAELGHQVLVHCRKALSSTHPGWFGKWKLREVGHGE